MDSEDEFMSDPLSQGEEEDFEEGTQDSEVGSLEGACDFIAAQTAVSVSQEDEG